MSRNKENKDCLSWHFPEVWHDLDYVLSKYSDFGTWFPLERYEYDWYFYDKTVPCDWETAGQLLRLSLYFPCTLLRGEDILMPG